MLLVFIWNLRKIQKKPTNQILLNSFNWVCDSITVVTCGKLRKQLDIALLLTWKKFNFNYIYMSWLCPPSNSLFIHCLPSALLFKVSECEIEKIFIKYQITNSHFQVFCLVLCFFFVNCFSLFLTFMNVEFITIKRLIIVNFEM